MAIAAVIEALRCGSALARSRRSSRPPARPTTRSCLGCHGDKVEARRASRRARTATRLRRLPRRHHRVPPSREAARRPTARAATTTSTTRPRSERARQAARSRRARRSRRCADCHGDIHAALPHTDAGSAVHWSAPRRAAARAATPRARPRSRSRIPVVRPVEAYLQSVHARAVAAGRARCDVRRLPRRARHPCRQPIPRSPLARAPRRRHLRHVPRRASCAAYRDSVHGEAAARGVRDAPVCTDCHGEHAILARTEPASPVFAANIPRETCGRCHDSIRLSAKYGLARGAGRRPSATASTASRSAPGSSPPPTARAATARTTSGPRATRARTCTRRTCPRPAASATPAPGRDVALGPVHVVADTAPARAVRWIRFVYLWLIGIVVGGMAGRTISLDLGRKARRRTPAPPPPPTDVRRAHAARRSAGSTAS